MAVYQCVIEFMDCMSNYIPLFFTDVKEMQFECIVLDLGI